eukprot:5095959-Lingulodinium_polyedra.AAC.1
MASKACMAMYHRSRRAAEVMRGGLPSRCVGASWAISVKDSVNFWQARSKVLLRDTDATAPGPRRNRASPVAGAFQSPPSS